jgi:RNA polymerase sigma factor (sigma-70 family)
MAGTAERVVETEERFDQLFRSYYPRLYGLVYRLLGDPAECDDTLQETFLKLAHSSILARPDDEVGAWLRRVCINQGVNRLRSQRRAQERVERSARLSPADLRETGPAEQVAQRELQREVRHALAVLPDRLRDTLLLRHSGYSYKEIADTLGIAIGSVGVFLVRAEAAFKVAYKEQQHELS